MSKTIAILTPKGGSGKTTLSLNVAAALHRRGESTFVIDTDPQGTATDWRARAPDGAVGVKHVAGRVRGLQEALRNQETARDTIIIDGGAQIDQTTGASIKAADLVLIPVRPSAADLWGVRDLVEVVKMRQEQEEGRPRAVFVVSQADPRTRLSRLVIEALEEYSFPVLGARTCQRIQYAKSLMNGSDVLTDAPQSKAAEEIEAITKEITEVKVL